MDCHSQNVMLAVKYDVRAAGYISNPPFRGGRVMMQAPVELAQKRRICGLEGTFVIACVEMQKGIGWCWMAPRALSKDVDTYFQMHVVTTHETPFAFVALLPTMNPAYR
jgi:hypothetical protein